MFYKRIHSRVVAGLQSDSRISLGLRISNYEFLVSQKPHLRNKLTYEENEMDKVFQSILERKLSKSDKIRMDQCTINIGSLRNRFCTIMRRLVYNDNVVFIGDNDLVSIALSYVTGIGKITVVDKDNDVLDIIQSKCCPNKKINVINDDFRRYAEITDVPDYGTYNLVVTDPPYTEVGYRLYLYIANQILELGGDIILTVPDMELESWNYELKYEIQKTLISEGFVVNDIKKRDQTFMDDYGIISSTWICTKIAIGEAKSIGNIDKMYTIR